MTIQPINEKNLAKAALLIQEGGLVAFPTETVYGLGADATNEKAVASIFEAKGRPSFNPLIVHVTKNTDLLPYVEWNDRARLLAKIFWPGPLTFVLRRAAGSPIAPSVSGKGDTIAVRSPNHAIAQELINRSGYPIAAPSANASGKLSPTTAEHVLDSLGDKVDMILDGGPTLVGLESTVLDLTSAVPTILRPGCVTKESLIALLGEVQEAKAITDAPQSPGMLSSHYAPRLPLRLNALCANDDEAFVTFGPDLFVHSGAYRINLSPRGNLDEAAANLFSMLRIVDREPYKGIAVMPIPMEGLGVAINDRLARAAAPRD
ncbi:MAG: L-threonylcarbamoyladenylate synthase [Bdellovibrionales bacterium]|jgi:L-threonylcarbamoyladenylate synthase